MKRTKKIVSDLLISPEIFISILLVILFFISKTPFKYIAEKVISSELLLFTPAVPWALLFFMLNNISHILRPDHRSKNVLMEWDDYSRYKDATYIGIFYIILGALIAATIVLTKSEITNPTFGLFLTVSYGISAVSFMTMFFAINKVEEILEKNT